MSTTTPCLPSCRSSSLTNRVGALAMLLEEEFGVPFAFYDAGTGFPVAKETHGPAQLDSATVSQLVRDGRVKVIPQPKGPCQMMLGICDGGRPTLVAFAEYIPLTRQKPKLVQELINLEKWLQAVSDRLKLTNQSRNRQQYDPWQETQVRMAWQTIFQLDQVIRQLRIHKEPAKNQQRILRSAFEILGVQTLVWVPYSVVDPIRIQGDPFLSAWDFRQLASRIVEFQHVKSSGLWIGNEFQKTSWGRPFPQIENLLAVPVGEQKSLGLVIAINKKDKLGSFQSSEKRKESSEDPSPPESPFASRSEVVPFRRTDAGLLTPFVSLLDLQFRGNSRYRELQNLLTELVRSLTAAIDAKDTYTYGHSERVARIAVELGRQMGLQEEELSDIFLAGLLHDIGKIGIRDEVLMKVEPLTVEEFEHIKQHVIIGWSIVQNLRPIAHLTPGIRNHHERYDGKGYPDGLAGESIPLIARILAVADSFDAMTNNRSYRDALPLSKVEQMLSEGAGTQWDKRVIEAYQASRDKILEIRQRGVGDSLRLALDQALRSIDSTLVPL